MGSPTVIRSAVVGTTLFQVTTVLAPMAAYFQVYQIYPDRNGLTRLDYSMPCSTESDAVAAFEAAVVNSVIENVFEQEN